MTPADKTTLKKKIEDDILSVTDEISAMKSVSKPVSPDSAIGRISRMEAINSKSIHEAALRSGQKRLKELEWALRHIDDPEFGLCESCEEPIPIGRLMVMPEATLCVRCAT